MSKRRRELVIDRCVLDACLGSSAGTRESLFRNGFMGYSNMSDTDLLEAYENAGLPERYNEIIGAEYSRVE